MAAVPDVSIIIVSYRCPGDLARCLRGLGGSEVQAEGPSREVIVVDNASGDDSEAVVRGTCPEATWIGLRSNRGFAAAVNVGLEGARADLALLLNPDAVIRPPVLAVLVETMRRHPRLGILGPRVLDPEGTFQRPCRRAFPTLRNTACHFAFRGRPPRWAGLPYELPPPADWTPGREPTATLPPEPVDAVSGSAMMLRRRLWEVLGGLDSGYFLNGEDLDLCRRAWERGYGVASAPGAYVVHRRGSSRRSRPAASVAAGTAAMERYFRKFVAPRYPRAFAGLIVAAIRGRGALALWRTRRQVGPTHQGRGHG